MKRHPILAGFVAASALSPLLAQINPGQMAAQQANQFMQMDLARLQSQIMRKTREAQQREARLRKTIDALNQHGGTNGLERAPEKEAWRLKVEPGDGNFGLPDGDQLPFMRRTVTRPYPRALDVISYRYEMLDLSTGKVAWTYDCQDQEIPMPLLLEDVAVFRTDKYEVVAIERSTGKERFKAQLDPLKKFVFGSKAPAVQDPVLDGRVLYTGTFGKNAQGEAAGRVYALDVQTGRQIWSQEVLGGVNQTPLIFEDLVIAGGGSWTFGLSAKDGKEVWRSYDPDHLAIGESFILGNQLVADCGSSVTALDARTGKRLWNAPIGGAEGRSFLVGEGDRILLVEHRVFGRSFARALDARTGQQVWELKLGSRMSTCWSQDGTALLQRGNEFLALAMTDGKELWHSTPEPLAAAYPIPTAAGILLARPLKKESRVQLLDFQTGTARWTFPIQEVVGDGPVLAGRGCLLFQTKQGTLICFR